MLVNKVRNPTTKDIKIFENFQHISLYEPIRLFQKNIKSNIVPAYIEKNLNDLVCEWPLRVNSGAP